MSLGPSAWCTADLMSTLTQDLASLVAGVELLVEGVAAVCVLHIVKQLQQAPDLQGAHS